MNGGFFSRIFFEDEKVASPHLDSRPSAPLRTCVRGNDTPWHADVLVDLRLGYQAAAVASLKRRIASICADGLVRPAFIVFKDRCVAPSSFQA